AIQSVPVVAREGRTPYDRPVARLAPHDAPVGWARRSPAPARERNLPGGLTPTRRPHKRPGAPRGKVPELARRVPPAPSRSVFENRVEDHTNRPSIPVGCVRFGGHERPK